MFRDVSADDWFFNAVYDAYGRGLMVGESSDLFAPNDSMTRAMLITTLYRMSGSPAVTGENPYSDVPQAATMRRLSSGPCRRVLPTAWAAASSSRTPA